MRAPGLLKSGVEAQLRFCQPPNSIETGKVKPDKSKLFKLPEVSPLLCFKKAVKNVFKGDLFLASTKRKFFFYMVQNDGIKLSPFCKLHLIAKSICKPMISTIY